MSAVRRYKDGTEVSSSLAMIFYIVAKGSRPLLVTSYVMTSLSEKQKYTSCLAMVIWRVKFEIKINAKNVSLKEQRGKERETWPPLYML